MSVSPGKRWYEVLSGEPVEGDPDGLRDPINVEGYEFMRREEVEAKVREFGEWTGRPHVALPVDQPPLEWIQTKLAYVQREIGRLVDLEARLIAAADELPDEDDWDGGY